MECVLTWPDAVLPAKAGPQEVGYDLTLVRVHERLDDDTIMYDTGVIAKPPEGYYLEVVPRSSIVKSGWIMANSVGIIDPTYRDTIKVVLKRVRSDTPEIELPKRLCQLLLRRMEGAGVVIRGVDALDHTTRTGGFGSTDGNV